MHELREFAGRSGWNIVTEYIDRASAKSGNRAQFQAMLTDASKRKFDMVLFWALDRFSREGTLSTLKYLERLTASGCNWRSYQESYLGSCGPFRDVVVSLMATIAKQERIRISERTIAGLNRAKRNGKKLGRPHVAIDFVKLRQLQAEGLSQRRIASATGLTATTVARALKVA